MTILCEPDSGVATELAPALDGPVTTVASLKAAAAGLDGDPSERVLVIGAKAPLRDVLRAAKKLRSRRPGLAILLLRHEILAEDVGRAVAAGVRQVIPDDDPRPLVEACRQLRAESALLVAERPSAEPAEDLPADEPVDVESIEPPEAERGRVITVFSPKGGSGKTTISTNLAVALHDDGARRVCLVDLDLEFGDVAISLRLEPVKSLVDAVTTDAPDDDDQAIAMLTTEFRSGLDCILAPIEPGDAGKIPVQLISDLLRLLRSRYDYIVVDTPSQLSENVLAAVDAADELVLLTNPEIPALKNLRLTLDVLDLLAYRREARLILFNKADDAAGLTATEVEGALGAPLAAQIPASRDVPASINKGVPIVAARPDHPVSVAIRGFARQFIVKVADPGKRRRSLFRRRSS